MITYLALGRGRRKHRSLYVVGHVRGGSVRRLDVDEGIRVFYWCDLRQRCLDTAQRESADTLLNESTNNRLLGGSLKYGSLRDEDG